jgi:hypothetical protein
MKLKASVYKGFISNPYKYGREMGLAIGLSDEIIQQAFKLYDEKWRHSPYSPQKTMVNCLYRIGKKYNQDITIRSVAKDLKSRFGVGTEPLTGWE